MFVCNVFGSNLKLNGNSLIEIYLITQRSFAEGCKNRQTKKTNELLLFCKLLDYEELVRSQSETSAEYLFKVINALHVLKVDNKNNGSLVTL